MQSQIVGNYTVLDKGLFHGFWEFTVIIYRFQQQYTVLNLIRHE